MIRGVPAMGQCGPEEPRRFLRDELGFTGADVGDGWMLFALPEADTDCLPL